jgi:hypothetical protein
MKMVQMICLFSDTFCALKNRKNVYRQEDPNTMDVILRVDQSFCTVDVTGSKRAHSAYLFLYFTILIKPNTPCGMKKWRANQI